MHHIFGKIQVFSGKCTANVIFFLIPALRQPLELGNDQVVAAAAAREGPHPVIDLLSPVQTQHHIVHLPVDKLLYLLIEQYSVGGQRKPEMLVILLLQVSSIGYQLFHCLPVHERLASEEIHLQIVPVPRILNQEVQRLPAYLRGHHGAPPVVFPFLCKTILAGKVAVMGNMEAQCLDHCLALLHFVYIILINVLGK